MASPATQPAPTPGRQAAYKDVAYEEFVDTRIRKTRAAVKTADLATGAVTLLAWTLAVLLIGAVADHWLVAGGFDRWGRFALFTIGVLGAGLYVATRLGPTLFLRVNPLYAAKEIERESPELKNSLLNLLQLRGTPGAGAAAVQQTLERQAAEGLAATGDAPIDHSPVVRAARVLLVLVAAIGLYVVASPKDFFASAARVIAPWANIAAPSRVRITDLTPGEIELAQGGRLEIGARVMGLAEDELAEIVYSTADGRLVESRVPMRAGSGGQQHTASLPPGGGSAAALGLQGDLTYRLEAGDARTPNYRVEVRTAPTIAPVLVRYEYPVYTGLETRDVEGVGDLRAIEGTRVTLTAQANLPIAAAQIDLGADGRPDSTMRAEGERAVGRLTLRRDPADATQTTTSYVLRFTSTDDQANHDPPQYRVEVLADLPPEAAILAPEEETLEVAVNERVRIEAEARDPDFALGGMRLVGELNGRRVLGRDLLRDDRRGRITGGTTVTPSELGASPGDTLTYWIEATDNRTPKANVGLSERQQLRITGPSDDAKGDPDRGDPREGQGKPDGPAQPKAKGDPEAGEPSQGGGEKGQPGGEPSDPDDANNAPGQEQQEEQQPGANERPQAEQSEDGQDGDAPDGGLRGPGEQGGDQGESDDAPEGGSEGDSNGESGADPQAGGAGSESGDSNQSPDGATEGAGGENNGGASSPAGEQGTDDGQADGDSPVPSNGEDDGSAFERIRKFLQDQQGNGQDSQSPPRDGGEQDGQQQDGQQRDGKQQDGQQQDGRDPADGQRGESSAGEKGESGESRDGSEKGNPRPRDGANGDQGKQPERPEDGPGPGERDRDGESSDSQTSESGGETPPGDSTDPNAGPREGTGSSGQNQAADQGAGQSGDRGAGESSDRPGGEQQADGETGESGGEQPGDGNQNRDGGEQAGGGGSQQPGEGQDANQANPSDSDPSGNDPSGDSGEAGSSDSGSDAGSETEGNEQQPLQDLRGKGTDGKAGDQQGKPVGFGDRDESSGEGSEVGGDEANLEYAREQTDLVLERLEEQLAESEVDRKLLDKLGWTEQDLQRFVERWKSRKQKATQRGAEGEAQLDRALRSLGLRPEGPSRTRPVADDQLRDLREGVRTKVPARWRDAVQRYNRSLNASGRSAADGK